MVDEAETTTELHESTGRPELTAVSDLTIARMNRRAQHRLRGANGRFISEPPVVTETGEETLPDDRFLDREVSWLQFNERVLDLAEDPHVPLLERTRFLAIFASNLDEFFMVRVAGLKRRIATGLAVRSASGLEPREVLDEISRAGHDLMNLHARAFHQVIRPDLAAQGIRIVRGEELDDDDRGHLKQFYDTQIFPVLTPLAVDPAHPFPYISGLSLNLAVLLINRKTEREHFARVKVPPALPRFIRLPVGHDEAGDEDLYSARFVAIEDVIAEHLGTLFPGMDVHEHFTFRVTRNEDLEVEEDDTENLLTVLERELTRRRFGPPVRLEVADDMDDHVLDMLVRELDVKPAEVYRLPEPLDLRGLNTVADLDRTELRWPAFVAKTHPDLAPIERSSQPDVFSAIEAGDILLHHPYDSFATTVQAFIEQAAADPHVLAIKQTLYRTSGDSPIIEALIEAAESGKQVLAVVEIKARFDEENNITWARKLERAGVHVVYGLVGLKTHAKLCLVVRREGEEMRRYCHVGTGNYNPKTARLYEDFGLLTADPVVADDLTRLFNQLSGMAPRARFKRLLVAPRTVRTGLLEHIEQATEAAETGAAAKVQIKVNSMVDEQIIDACYRASQAGVDVDIWVRGICALRPGLPGLSERIRVRSVLGRFLEHSRVFRIAIEGQEDVVFIGSADMMHRNLDRRVEALVRITDKRHIKALRDILELGMSDNIQSWHLNGDGHWARHHLDDEGVPLRDVQAELIDIYSRRRLKARRR